MKITKFEEIIAWQKAQDFTVDLYDKFKNIKDWDYRNQICRAAISISNNIAEGFDRSSNAEFKRFLYFSYASCSEVRSMLYLSQKLGYLSHEDKDLLIARSSEISKILTGLIRSLKINK